MRVGFGDWVPDLPPLAAGNGIMVAKNCVPRKAGYGPLNSLSDLGLNPLTGYVRGAISGIDVNGTPYNFAGDFDSLHKLTEDNLIDVSRAAGYSAGERWEFAQFSNDIFAANYNDETQYYNLRTSTDFADMDDGTPRAKHLAVMGSFLVMGFTYDKRDGVQSQRVWWSALSNPFSWPTPGTDAAVSVQSDYNDLQGEGGWVQRVISGAEVGAVFQERRIWRMDYRGGDVVWEFSDVERKHGLLVPGICVAVGRRIFYLSEEGFQWFDYTGSVPIGEEKVNRYFLDDIDSSYFDRCSAEADPDRPLIYVAYPGSGNSGGVPNKVLIYNYEVNKFSVAEIEVEYLLRVIEPGGNLDSDPLENIDTATGSFDDRETEVGAQTIGGFSSEHSLGKFTGSALAATLETGDLELQPGRRSRVNFVRPLVDGADASVQVAGRPKNNSDLKWGPIVFQQHDGRCAFRYDSRFHRIRVNIPEGGFDNAVGVDVGFAPMGVR